MRHLDRLGHGPGGSAWGGGLLHEMVPDQTTDARKSAGVGADAIQKAGRIDDSRALRHLLSVSDPILALGLLSRQR